VDSAASASPGARQVSYRVQLAVFEGPLDLLLHLIESERLDISSISVAQIADQFLDYLKKAQSIGASDLADFLVMAARLVWIKSRVLLPSSAPNPGEEEDPGEALANQLREYKRYREVARKLRAAEELGQHSFVRAPAMPEIERHLAESSITLMDLYMAAQAAFAPEADAVPAPVGIVIPHLVTVRQQMHAIRKALDDGWPVAFKAFIGRAPSRLEVIVTLLAVLELLKRRLVAVEQNALFGEIMITSRAETAAGDGEPEDETVDPS
jgi:segregation and condensation protein A